MALMTFNSLFKQVKDYLDRTDTSTLAEIPNFIYQAEQRICRESKSIGLESYVTGLFIPGVCVYQKPARWRRNIAMNYGIPNVVGLGDVRKQIMLRGYDYIVNYWKDRTETGAPEFYSDYGYNNYLIAPTPDQAYYYEFSYLELPEPITENNQTNWLTDFAPDVLLYATLLEAIPYLKDDERVPMWEAKYQSAMSSLNGQDDMRLTDRANDRTAD